jgi:glutamate-1-semialdehyde 2,1-aminomutase
LTELKNNPAIYEELEAKTKYLGDGIERVLTKRGIDFRINRMGSMISLHFCNHAIVDFETASKANIPLFNKLFHHLLDNGIYLPPSAYESWFLNNALSYEDLDKTIAAIDSFDQY